MHLLDLVFDFLNAQLVLRRFRVYLALIYVVQKQLLLIEDGNMLRLVLSFFDGVSELKVARLFHERAQRVVLARLSVLDLVLVLKEFKQLVRVDLRDVFLPVLMVHLLHDAAVVVVALHLKEGMI